MLHSIYLGVYIYAMDLDLESAQAALYASSTGWTTRFLRRGWVSTLPSASTDARSVAAFPA